MMSETRWKAVENVVIFSERSIVIKLPGNVHGGLVFTRASSWCEHKQYYDIVLQKGSLFDENMKKYNKVTSITA